MLVFHDLIGFTQFPYTGSRVIMHFGLHFLEQSVVIWNHCSYLNALDTWLLEIGKTLSVVSSFSVVGVFEEVSVSLV